jgi:hypothetical protein
MTDDVAVGESSRQETAITVTGLKAGHFYNVRVIAVGNNNFQAGSRVIRLRTYGKDGRPELGNGRIPANLAVDDMPNGTVVDSSDESAGVRSHGAGLETVAAEGAPAMAREQSSGHLGQRRNTVGRRHSPSTASEHPMPPIPPVPPLRGDRDESMQQLTERFETIRAETEDTVMQVSKDADDFKIQIAELIKERDEKRQMLKEKEEASEKLKKEVHNSERTNRQAQNRKTTKEKALREKEAERTKMQEDMARWRREIQEMRDEREIWQKERDKIAKSTEKKTEELKDILRKRQNSLNGMEEEIRVKGLQIKELEEERQKLPGVEDDEEAEERDAAERKKDIEWERKERELIARYNTQSIILRNFDQEMQRAQVFFSQLSARQAINPIMYHGNSSGIDYDQNQNQSVVSLVKTRRTRQRRSPTPHMSSPVAVYPNPENSFPIAVAYNNLNATTSPSFAPGPYFDLSAADTGMLQISDGMSDADIRALTAGAPLSPTASSLLPASLFIDDDPPSPSVALRSLGPSPFGPLGSSAYENEHNSPQSSSRSASLISSPQSSSHNLQSFPPSMDVDNDRHSLHSPAADFGVIGSPSGSSVQPPPARRFGDIFTFPRPRGKTMQDDGPALGTLKLGQSQSFPRQEQEIDPLAVRNRRTSFSTGWGGLPFLNRGGSDGNAPAPARNVARRRRGFNMFGSSIDDPAAVYSERDPSSPRPASIASSDLPRPSTDSAPFGWPAAESGVINRNSPLATNWSVNVSQPWSRNPSRRPSIQHASTSALSTGIAADDDEFLPHDMLSQQASPPPVGVIGTRPVSATSATPRLNPAAPTFMAKFSRGSKADRPDRRHRKEPSDLADESYEEATSPSDSRKSRDTRSIRTQASITESYDSLDRTVSNTPSEMTTPSATSTRDSVRDAKENSFQKLLRKGSSSKFSIGSFRDKSGSSLFGKKGAISGERNASGDRSSFGDLDEGWEESVPGRGMESVTSSPATPSGTPREGRMSVNWGRFGINKKGKEKARESIDISEGNAREREKERASETEGTEDDER